MRVAASLVVSVLLFAVAPSIVAEEPPPPEILASLFPANGFEPRAGEPQVYTFQAWALTVEEPHESRARTDVLLQAGQTQELSFHGTEYQIEGSVTLTSRGKLMYRLTLFHRGERVTSSSASIDLNGGPIKGEQ